MALLLVPGPVRRAGVTARRRVMGLAFVGVCVGLLTLTVLVYQKAFTPVVPVTLQASSIGNQLVVPADVKLRGIIVGEVRSVHTNGKRATLDLALHPDAVGMIPANVQARILPKTLFGEKFVDLVVPAKPSPHHIAAGAVIPEDRSRNAIELEHVFDDVLPLLRTLKPAQLDMTLSAMADALQDRGAKLGHNITLVDDYFKQLNRHLPSIDADISGLADLASNLDDAAPDLLSMARNFSVTARTTVEKQQTLRQFFAATTGFADTTTSTLQRNANRLITLAAVSRPTVETLASYSGMFPCFLKGLTDLEQRIEPVFAQGPYLHIDLQLVNSRGAYLPGVDYPDNHHYAPASCYGLPWAGSPPPGSSPLPAAPGEIGPVGSAAEKALVGALVAPTASGSLPSSSDLADLLMGPMLRGTQVSQR